MREPMPEGLRWKARLMHRFQGMKSVTAETKGNPAFVDDARLEIEQECETWDWARTAGVSAAELRDVLRQSLSAAMPQD